MRLQARLHDFNDARGFGFVTPDGGERAFVHIKAFAGSTRRPLNGDMLSFELQRDQQGRLNARDIRFASGDRAAPARREGAPGNARKRPLRGVLALAFLLALTAAWLAGAVPAIAPLAYLVMSVLSLLLYAWDKSAARRSARRVPENQLHMLDLLCGWPGGLLAQGLLRHKSSKRSFQITFWFTVLLNLAGVYWLRHEGLLDQLQRAVFG